MRVVFTLILSAWISSAALCNKIDPSELAKELRIAIGNSRNAIQTLKTGEVDKLLASLKEIEASLKQENPKAPSTQVEVLIRRYTKYRGESDEGRLVFERELKRILGDISPYVENLFKSYARYPNRVDAAKKVDDWIADRAQVLSNENEKELHSTYLRFWCDWKEVKLSLLAIQGNEAEIHKVAVEVLEKLKVEKGPVSPEWMAQKEASFSWIESHGKDFIAVAQAIDAVQVEYLSLPFYRL